ncbi:CD99 antigen-like protein 2 isoform X2 [Xenopus laevis]|uniref:CD99 antigen-like protein 2 n=1 Tax=Xenopus laevis TaxID=8355 RepID=A0A8J0TGX1_XENLA|nr:CD99 antigen-like protein 2 isoform X2 [Xenopus laevis]
MAKWSSPLVLTLAFLAMGWKAYAQDFDLYDALGDPTEKPKPKPKPPKNPTRDSGDLDLSDFFDTPVKTTTKSPRRVTKPPPKQPDLWFSTTTKSPKKPPKKPDSNDFDLSDALDGKNDRKDDISDSDLDDIFNDGYNPDKKKGGGGGGGRAAGQGDNDSSDSGFGSQAETGTIAGIASALGMALIGAVSSYISYQKKKFCFSIQEGLNAQYVKGENMEAVMCEEPQVKYSALESQSAAPLTEEAAKV